MILLEPILRSPKNSNILLFGVSWVMLEKRLDFAVGEIEGFLHDEDGRVDGRVFGGKDAKGCGDFNSIVVGN